MSRYTMGDVVKRRTPIRNLPDVIGGWWYECPWRSLRNFRTLLLEPGYGWLRWGTVVEQEPHGQYEPGEQYWVAPPLRRLWEQLRYGMPMRDWPERYYRWPDDFITGPPRKGWVRW